jgi:hypothetical protein
MIAGSPTEGSAACASSKDLTMRERGMARPIFSMAARNRSRSSALAMTSERAPIISTPCASSTPERASSSPVLSAVCPPMVGNSASGFSRAMILARVSWVIGST